VNSQGGLLQWVKAFPGDAPADIFNLFCFLIHPARLKFHFSTSTRSESTLSVLRRQTQRICRTWWNVEKWNFNRLGGSRKNRKRLKDVCGRIA